MLNDQLMLEFALMKNNESSALKFIIFRNVYRNRVLAPYRWGRLPGLR